MRNKKYIVVVGNIELQFDLLIDSFEIVKAFTDNGYKVTIYEAVIED